MKFKYYMRGFGAGLIIATIVLMVAGKIQNNNKALVTDNNENQRTGSVIAFTTESSTEGTENAESETETESQKQENESTIQATTVSETKTETVASQEASTQRPTVDGSGEVELVFSGVYTAAQAADILFDAGIIDNKTEFYTYMYTSGYDRKMRDGTYRLKPGDSYDTIAKTITQTK